MKLKELENRLEQESKEHSDYASKYSTLQAGWSDLTQLLQAETADAKARAAEAQARSER